MAEHTVPWLFTYVDAFVGETGGNCRALFFCVAQEDWKLVHGRHGNITPIVPRQKGLQISSAHLIRFRSVDLYRSNLALQVEEEDSGRHYEQERVSGKEGSALSAGNRNNRESDQPKHPWESQSDVDVVRSVVLTTLAVQNPTYRTKLGSSGDAVSLSQCG